MNETNGTQAVFKAVKSQVDFPEMERKVLRFWQENDLYRQSVDSRPAEKPFRFFDGPPFATGLPHYGHLLASITKDVVPRYWTMRGYRVERRWGWDCHGLPVENEAEQQLGLKSRPDILEFGVKKFNEFCREVVMTYTSEWNQLINRMGRWVDWDKQYRTMDPEFMESVWWVFKSLWDKQLIYEGYKSLAYCPRCATPLSNFEVNQGYQDTQDPSITIRFKVKGEEKLSILAWTTTPWTLPSNMGLAVGKDVEYVRVIMKDGEQLILAKARMEAVFGKQKEEIASVEAQPVDELLQMTYEPLFDYFEDLWNEGAFRVVPADFVSVEDGTGIVHTAPGFGEDDYQLGQQEGLPTVCPIDADCRFTEEVTDYVGEFVKDVDKAVVRRLRDEGSLVNESTLVHSYPFCWRCDAPLIYRTISTWFVKVEGDLKEKMINANKQIWWIPEHIRDGRFGKWLEGARDWAISRNRYWGTPLPIWRNEETGEAVCVGSAAELEELTGENVDDLHKHCIDHLEIPAPSGNGTLQRVPEVLDCWFESGAMPYAQNHYPFGSKEAFEASFPADFISENLDQTRGWFYTLTILSAALFDKPAFQNCIVGGMLLAEDGRKLSKRLRNYPDPGEMLEKYGADAMRLYLLNSPAMKAEELRLTESGMNQSLRDVIIPLWNAYSFFVTYANIDGWSPDKDGEMSTNRLDRWIVSELQTLLHDINAEMEAYRLYRTVPAMVSFVEKLTNWYIRRSRRRFWKSEDDSDKLSAYATLYQVLVTFTKALAPVLPFVTEQIYQNLVRSYDADAPCSIHLCDMPQAAKGLRDSELEEQMSLATRAVVLGRSLRSKHDLKVRQPLRKLYLLPPDEHIRDELVEMGDLISDELNIKEIVMVEDETELSEVSYKPNFRALGPRFGKRMKEVGAWVQAMTAADIKALKDGGSIDVADGQITIDDLEAMRSEKDELVVAVDNNLVVGLDVHLDDELIQECTARELVNRIQNMRKDAGFDVSDRISVGIQGEDGLESAAKAHRDYVAGEVLAEDVVIGSIPEGLAVRLESKVNGHEGTLALRKL
ncbi:TPA: isoleucine--tRNA ligase [Candidatus Latescibacteria bacterium]|mgnify:FL=1|nr:isoleucine--tRNA ligase [Candidatus Latescibacterota bacterium]